MAGFTVSGKAQKLFTMINVLVVVAILTYPIAVRAAALSGLWKILEDNPGLTKAVPVVSMMVIHVLCLMCAMASNMIIAASTEGYDNREPRKSERSGISARLYWAHANLNESVAVYCTAVVTAMVLSEDKAVLAFLCIYYVVVRVLHVIAYIGDLDLVRSLAYTINFTTAILILSLALGDVNANPVLKTLLGISVSPEKGSEPVVNLSEEL